MESKIRNSYNLSELEYLRLKYIVSTMVNELSKLAVIWFVFKLLNDTETFSYILFSLLTIRTFTGGLHFKKSYQCFLFTLLFFLLIYSCLVNIEISSMTCSLLLFISVIIVYLVGPIQSSSRPKATVNKTCRNKKIAILIICTHIIVFLLPININYLICSTWVIFFQSTQLLIAKGVKYHEQNH